MSIAIRGLSKAFDGNPVLKDVSLDIPEGELVALPGELGSGGPGTRTARVTTLRTVSPTGRQRGRAGTKKIPSVHWDGCPVPYRRTRLTFSVSV